MVVSVETCKLDGILGRVCVSKSLWQKYNLSFLGIVRRLDNNGGSKSVRSHLEPDCTLKLTRSMKRFRCACGIYVSGHELRSREDLYTRGLVVERSISK
jgi:hypothetical protein